MVHFFMVKNSSRRNFIRSAPLAAAAVTVPDLLFAQSAAPAVQHPYELFEADKLAQAMANLQTTPGNDNLFTTSSLPFTIVLTTEVKKSAKEFEWHEGRDHILQILDGSTSYELGGRPQGSHSAKPAEWNAPASQGATTVMLHKGDMLVIPRGLPHKRTTADSVTFYLISTTGNAAGK
jgi:mannose-6-phosphate isomerase-like protein (cupin superfamily)